MAEEGISKELEQRDMEKAAAFAEKQLPKVDNPLARFNLEHDTWHPTEESGRPLLPSHETKGVGEALRNPHRIMDPKTGQEFRVVQLNWKDMEKQVGDESDGDRTRPVMYVPEYGWSAADKGPLTTGEKSTVQLRLEEMVRQTGRPVFSIDYPGWGSDKMTREQKTALKAGDYSPIAEAQLRVMKEMGVTDVDLVGLSMGGWAAASMAEHAEEMGINVHNLVAVESPGVEEMSAAKLMSGETSEAKRLELYQSMPYDNRLREASGQFKSAFRRNIDLAKWGLGGMRGGGMSYIKAMGRETMGQHFDKALESNPDLHIQVVHTTESKVSPSEANTGLVKGLQEKYQDRIHQSVYSGDSHAGFENAQKFGTAIRLALEPTAKK